MNMRERGEEKATQIYSLQPLILRQFLDMVGGQDLTSGLRWQKLTLPSL